MSDGSISQDEIDALLSGGNSSPAPSKATVIQAGFDGLAKFTSGNAPSFSAKLATATGASANISMIALEEKDKESFLKRLPDMVVATYIDFSGMMQGGHTFVLSEALAKKIIELENHEKDVEIDEMGLSIISEGISQFVGAEVTALEAASLKGVVSNTPNSVHVPKAALNLPLANFMSIAYNVKLADEDYEMWEVFVSDVANKIEETISGPKVAPQGASVAPNMMQGMPQMTGQMNGGQFMMGQGGMPVMNNPNVQPVQFSQLQNFTSQAEAGNIGLIMDVYMEMTVELGRTKKMIKEILGMGEGHIIELDKLAGEPVDILVNHKPIAKGEVVVIEENFGVRVTEILSPLEHIADV
ncbi:MAG: flagellar motor switch protein FliN [Treponema sp.]